MVDFERDKKPVGKCRKCGIDVYHKRGEKIVQCPNCGPLKTKDINHYMYPSTFNFPYTNDK